MEGRGRIGQHALQPVTVHHTDAYTPYGPIVTSEDGMAFFTIRSRTENGGTHYMLVAAGADGTRVLFIQFPPESRLTA